MYKVIKSYRQVLGSQQKHYFGYFQMNKHKIEIVGCGNESIQHSIHDLSFFSMDIGNDNYAW